MTIIHANAPTTKVLSYLYEQRHDISAFVTESSTNGDVKRAIRGDDTIMMLGMAISMDCSQSPIRTAISSAF